MSENEIRVLYVQPGKYPEERTIPNTLRALQELVGGDIECCRPWRDSVCVICNDSGKIDGLPPNRLYGHTDFLAGSFVVCGNGGEDFISLTDRQVFLYERLYHMYFLPSMRKPTNLKAAMIYIPHRSFATDCWMIWPSPCCCRQSATTTLQIWIRTKLHECGPLGSL